MDKLEATLAELAERRAAFKQFAQAVEEDLARQREERLGAEKNAIRVLMLKASAEGATLGQIKRAYGTTDHRTVASVVHGGAAEIEALRTAAVEEVKGQPDWLHLLSENEAVIQVGEHSATYQWTTMDDGSLLFTTGAPLWDDSFTHKNEAVSLLDGKNEKDTPEARLLAKFIRKSR